MLNVFKLVTLKYGPYVALAIALASLVGSLYFSEIAGIVPCVLCWYQRICMYPLIVIIAVGIYRQDKQMSFYALPLSIIGAIIALYQNLLVWNVISESLAPCVSGVSCVTQVWTVFGFITIPFLSLISFILITWLMLVHRSVYQNG